MAGLNETAVTTPRAFSLISVSPSVVSYPLAGPTGGNAGDRLQRLVFNVQNPNNASILLFDGGEEYEAILPGPNIPVGPMQIELGVYSMLGGWSVMAGGGILSCLAIGSFS